jgi:eukaryotic-like serine/threonine-protein kinase
MRSASAAARPAGSVDPGFADLVEELTARLHAGEGVDEEALLAAHPEHAERLRGLLPALRMLADLSRSGPRELAGVLGPDGEQAACSRLLGDFRIIREVGRGGMGVVYEAEQISLGRRVALKVLPFAATLDPRHLQRFHNEARAAACLHHPHIVPVFGVGCERGVHFYAMQFIEGRPLSELIRERAGGAAEAPTAGAVAETAPLAKAPTAASGGRDPAYLRRVAELGAQAAEALEYAHSLGVVHRDVKPANLLLDGRGEVWVADFGLAKLGTAEGVTMPGDLLGTLRYMSPEQALAKHGLVDHRTDVYGLGATLYELLTLRPALEGTDREEVFRRIAQEEPAAPRKLNRHIPADLETVVLKCLAKDPADRYATAKELADDLRHWLDDRPIRARRPSISQRLRRWARKHRAAVVAGVVIVLTAAVLGGTVALWRLGQQASAGREAEAALEDADRLQAARRCPEALAAARRAKPLLAAGVLAEPLQRRVRRRIADLEMVGLLEEISLLRLALNQTGDQWDFDVPARAYQEAFRDYGLEVGEGSTEEAVARIGETTIREELAAALEDWATLLPVATPAGAAERKRLLGLARAIDPDEVRDQLRDALARNDLTSLRRWASPERCRGLPPVTLTRLGRDLRLGGAVEQAVTLLEAARQAHPGDFWINFELASALSLQQPPRLEGAVRYYAVAVALRPDSPVPHHNLGVFLSKQGRPKEAIAAFRAAIRRKRDFALAHLALGAALARQERFEEALPALREAVRLVPANGDARVELGVALRQSGRYGDAVREMREAVRLNPKNPSARVQLGALLRNHLKDPDGAIREYQEAVRLRPNDAETHGLLGDALWDRRRLKEAIAAYRKSRELQPGDAALLERLGTVLNQDGQNAEAVRAFHESVRLAPGRARAWYRLGKTLMAMRNWDEAVTAYRQAICLEPHDAKAHYQLGLALGEQGRVEEEMGAYRQAIKLQPEFAEAHCNLGDCLLKKGRFKEALAARRRGHELGSKQRGWRYPSLQWVRQAEHLVKLETKLGAVLRGEKRPAGAVERVELAQMSAFKSLNATAARLYQEAFAERPGLADDLRPTFRYKAACAAALAGCGKGKDAPADEKERARLRRQALGWLRAARAAWQTVLEGDESKAATAVAGQMQHWLKDADFAGVRGPQALAKLPQAERRDWQKLWEDVEALRRRAAGGATPPPYREKEVPPGNK